MATLIRILSDGVIIDGTVYASGNVVNADDNRATKLISAGVAESIEADSWDVDTVTESTHKWGARLALAGAAQTLDLTSLAAAGAARAGSSTNFSAIHSIVIRNLGTGTQTITVGAAASNQFDGFFGGSTHTLKIPAGGSIALRTKVAAGLTTSSKNNLKLDPGADTFAATIAIAGIGA